MQKTALILLCLSAASPVTAMLLKDLYNSHRVISLSYSVNSAVPEAFKDYDPNNRDFLNCPIVPKKKSPKSLACAQALYDDFKTRDTTLPTTFASEKEKYEYITFEVCGSHWDSHFRLPFFIGHILMLKKHRAAIHQIPDGKSHDYHLSSATNLVLYPCRIAAALSIGVGAYYWLRK